MVQEVVSMLQRTRKVAGGCDDGPCPAIHETNQPPTIAVQGYIPTPEEVAAMDLPAGEAVILVPRSLLEDYAAGR